MCRALRRKYPDPFLALLLVAREVGVAITTDGTGRLAPPNTVMIPIKQDSLRLRHGVAWMTGMERVARDAVLDAIKDIFP